TVPLTLQIPSNAPAGRPFSDRLGRWLPVVVAFGLPTFFLPNLIDEFILPRASLVIAGACLGAGLALLTPDRPSLGRLLWPLVAIARALRGGLFSVAWWLGVVALAAGLYASTSRAGALGVMAGCLALVVLRLKGRTALFSAAGAAGLVALALLAILISPLREL